MQKINNRGFSAIIQSTLIMLLSISAIFTVWVYVKDISADFDRQLSPTVDCIQQESKILGACINPDGKIKVTTDIGLGEEIQNLDLTFKDESFSCNKNTCSSCDISDKEGRTTIYLEPQTQVSIQDKLIASINGCSSEQIQITQCS